MRNQQFLKEFCAKEINGVFLLNIDLEKIIKIIKGRNQLSEVFVNEIFICVYIF